MSRYEAMVTVYEWGDAQTEKAQQMVRALPLGLWLEVAYGFDKACGFFLQARCEGADEWAVDFDSLFDGLSGGEMLHLFGVLRMPLAQSVVASMAMDLEF